MAKYHVSPAGNHWQVRLENSGIESSGHNKKTGAKRKAYDLAESGDEIVIHSKRGQILESRTVRQ